MSIKTEKKGDDMSYVFTYDEIAMVKKFRVAKDKNKKISLVEFYAENQIREEEQLGTFKFINLYTKLFDTGEIDIKDTYTFRNHPENVKRTEEYSQVCVMHLPNSILKELDIEVGDEEYFLDYLFKEELKTRFKYLETFSDKPMWRACGHKYDENGSYILFAIHEKDLEVFALERFKYKISWLEDKTSSNNMYYEKNFFPERVLAYRTWCGDVSKEMLKKVYDREKNRGKN